MGEISTPEYWKRSKLRSEYGIVAGAGLTAAGILAGPAALVVAGLIVGGIAGLRRIDAHFQGKKG